MTSTTPPAVSEAREIPTSEVAARLGIRPDRLRKWKQLGYLPKGPHGVSGQGRGVECFWSTEAVEEARAVMATRKPGRPKKRTEP